MIALLIDADNFSSPAWVIEAIEILERNDGSVAIRRAYGCAENIKGLAEVLRLRAIRPFVNLPLPKNTTDISLAVDAMELACQTPCPKLMVIASGDMDFVPLAVRLRERGIRVVCVSVRSKMAQDAIPAYDQIIYVGGDQPVGLTMAADALETKPIAAVSTIPATPKKTVVNTPLAKATAPKSATVKTGGKKTVSKPTIASLSPETIIKTLPNLKTGQWLHLSAVAKILHEKKLLAKSASSTKLFKKFPQYFELKPATKPNQVRLIKP